MRIFTFSLILKTGGQGFIQWLSVIKDSSSRFRCIIFSFAFLCLLRRDHKMPITAPSFLSIHPQQGGKGSSQPFIKEKKSLPESPIRHSLLTLQPLFSLFGQTRSKVHMKANQFRFFDSSLIARGRAHLWSAT